MLTACGGITGVLRTALVAVEGSVNTYKLGDVQLFVMSILPLKLLTVVVGWSQGRKETRYVKRCSDGATLLI